MVVAAIEDDPGRVVAGARGGEDAAAHGGAQRTGLLGSQAAGFGDVRVGAGEQRGGRGEQRAPRDPTRVNSLTVQRAGRDGSVNA